MVWCVSLIQVFPTIPDIRIPFCCAEICYKVGLLWNDQIPYLFTVLIAPEYEIFLLLTFTYVTASSYKHAFDGLFRVITEGWQWISDANFVTEGMYFSGFKMLSCRGNSQPMERIISICHQSNTDNHFSGVCKGRLKPFSFSHMWSTNVGYHVWASEASPDWIRVSFSSTLCTFDLMVTRVQASECDLWFIGLLSFCRYFQDNIITHFSSSITAVSVLTNFAEIFFQVECFLPFFLTREQGFIATAMTQPVDVVKTRMMNAKPGDYKVELFHCYWSRTVMELLLVADTIFLVVFYCHFSN